MKLHIRFYELCWFFLLGAFVYSLLEIVCRGYTHWTMTLTGGTAAVGLYLLHAAAPPKTLLLQCLCGALLITMMGSAKSFLRSSAAPCRFVMWLPPFAEKMRGAAEKR